ncbi:MAG: glycosyltransferase, partial [Sphingopyxis sp.]
VAPVGLPPIIGRHHPHYRALAALPRYEEWRGLNVYRPHFAHIPGVGGRFDAAMLARALRPLLRTIRAEFPFDIIDASFFFPDGPAAVALGREMGVPVSIKARGGDIHHWGAGGAARRQIVDAGQRADGLLSVCAALKQDMAAMAMPAERIRVHYTGIDRRIFYVRDRAAAKMAMGVAGPLIATVGALIPRKGQEQVIRAIALVPDAQLVIIGQGPDRARLEQIASELGVAHRVRFTGSLPLADIADWLAAADAMALASASEGLANVWIEALASGTPLVLNRIDSAAEVMDRPAAGCMVDPTPAAMAAGLQSILRANPPRDDVAASVAAFSWDANAAHLHDHLASIVARYRAGRGGRPNAAR